MDEAHLRANETRKRNEQARRERYAAERAERAAQLAALRKIRDSEDATVEQRLDAIQLIERISSKY